MDTRDRIELHLRQLAPHVKERETGELLAAALVEIDRLRPDSELLKQVLGGIVYVPKRDIQEAEKGVRYIVACEVTDAQREQALKSELYKQGDMRLVWVNEGDLYAFWKPSA